MTVRAQWVAELRSGNYKQGTGRLRQQCGEDYVWCCLGVLCNIVAPNEWRPLPWHTDLIEWLHDTQGSLPLPSITEGVGLSSRDVDVLAHKNDYGCSFDEIADYIEAGLPEDVE